MYNRVSASKILYWLSLGSFSVRRQKELVSRYKTLDELWDDFPKNPVVREFVGEKAFGELSRFRSVDYIEKSLSGLRDKDVGVITILNPIFPERLRRPEVNAPLVLYYRGDPKILADESVAVVGTRACSTYGMEVAKNIGYDLGAAGVTVVSGLATGIDSYAHEGTIAASGKCVAVIGGGLDHVTPVGNIKIHDKIIESGGAVVSEYRPEFPPNKFTFPERNRLISGLSLGTVVVEAGEKSGALITASCALDQGRYVFAVPGPVTSERSKGCNELLYQGACVARNAEDILSVIRPNVVTTNLKSDKKSAATEKIVDKDQKTVYSLLSDEAKTMDEIIEGSGLPPAAIAEILLDMELKDLIVRSGNNAFRRKS